MDYHAIMLVAMDEAIVLDGDENAVQTSGWLQAHDDRFHNPNHEEHGHFDPQTMTCGLRDRLSNLDDVDKLEGINMNRIPSREQFNDLLSRLESAGTIDSDIREDINRMVRAGDRLLEQGDDENFNPSREDLENIRALMEVYGALSSLENPPDNLPSPQEHQPEPEQIPVENPRTNEELTAEDLRRYLNEFAVSDENRRRGNRALRSGEIWWLSRLDRESRFNRLMPRFRDIYRHFGANHPLVNAMRSHMEDRLRSELANAGREGDPWPTFNPLNVRPGFRIPRGELTREQVTPQLIDNISARLPRSYLGSLGAEYAVGRLMTVPERYQDQLRALENATNPAGIALYNAVKAVHPDLTQRIQQLRQQEEAEQERAQRRYNLRNIINTTSHIDDFPIAEEALVDAGRIIGEHLQDETLSSQIVNALRNGAVPAESSMNSLRNVLGNDNPVVRALETRREAEAAINQEVKTYRLPTPPEIVTANDSLMASAGISKMQGEPRPVHVSGAEHGLVCYATIQAIRANLLGYNCDTYTTSDGYYGSNRDNFIASRGAMATAGYEVTNKGSTTEVFENLERIRKTYPDGTFLDNWTGNNGHGTGALLYKKRWYFFDGYHGTFYQHSDSNYLSSRIYKTTVGSNVTDWSMGSTAGRQIINNARVAVSQNPRYSGRVFTDEELYERGKRQLIILAKRATPVAERAQYSDDQYVKKGYELTSQGANLSFVITPDKPLCNEILRVIRPR